MIYGGPCVNCGLPFDEVRFPLAPPRKDGRQYPIRYCDTCRALPVRKGGGREARLLSKKLSERRARIRRAAA